MHCPNCGSYDYLEGELCALCVENPGPLVDSAAADRRIKALLESHRAGRRNTMVGALLLAGSCLIILALRSNGVPPFLGFLWTCWMFLGGAIEIAAGGGKWLSSSRRIKALGCASSRQSSTTDTEERSKQEGQRSKIPEADSGLLQESSTPLLDNER